MRTGICARVRFHPQRSGADRLGAKYDCANLWHARRCMSFHRLRRETIFAITTRCARVFLELGAANPEKEAMLPIIMPGIAWTKTALAYGMGIQSLC